MKQNRFKAEHIISMVREIEVHLSKGKGKEGILLFCIRLRFASERSVNSSPCASAVPR
jgi:hypothetical protein